MLIDMRFFFYKKQFENVGKSTIIECHFGGFDEQNNPAFQSTQIFGG